MKLLEHGQEHAQTLLFFPCTAEPVWAFSQTIALLSQTWHVFLVVFDGHQPEYPGDFTCVEQTVDDVTAALKSIGVSRLDAAYGCSLGGACLTRLLALGGNSGRTGDHRRRHHALSAAAAGAKAAAGAGYPVFQAGRKQPKNSGGGISARTLYPAGA